MNSLRLANLRSLRDTGMVQLRPLTLLVGRNSSGKSTFLRFLPLLRQSVEAATTGPLLWYGDYVDFGSFSDAIRKNANGTMEIGFSATLPWPTSPYTRRRMGFEFATGPLSTEATLTLSARPRDGSAFVAAVRMSVEDHRIHLQFDADGNLEFCEINGQEFPSGDVGLRSSPYSKVVPVVEHAVEGSVLRSRSQFPLGKAAEPALAALAPLLHGNTSDQKKLELIDRLGVGSQATMLQALKKLQGGRRWEDNVARLKVHSSEFQKIATSVMFLHLPRILYWLDHYLVEMAARIRYIAPVRAVAQRYYRAQGLAVSEVDYEGKNLAMFLRSLSDAARRRFADWLRAGLGFRVDARAMPGHVFLTITESDSGVEYNLADVGFGISQVLPVLAQLWMLLDKNAVPRNRRMGASQPPHTFAIEQPELHLHPAMQAQVAELFVNTTQAARAAGASLRLVVETHSEAIVNRVGELVASGAIAPELVNVVIFDRPGLDTEVRVAGYDSDGQLEAWPYGFFLPDAH